MLGSTRKEALLDAVHTEEKYEKEAAAQWLYDVGLMKTTPYRDVLVALDDMDAYYHEAQRERQVVIAGRRMDAIDVAGDLAEKVRRIGQSKYVTDNVRSVKNDVINGLHFTKNILTRMEYLCYFFDGDRKGVGPWLKNVFAPVSAAGIRSRQRIDAVAKEFREILDGFEFGKGVIHSGELDFTFGKGRRSSTGYAKAEIIALILQTGTESNLKKLLAGYGWTVFDRFIICPTWIASYNNALASGLTEKDAILKADSDVRRVQSDYSPESLSNLEAGSPFVRLFTQFTSYFITRGNLVASESSVAIRQGASKLAVMFGWMLMAGIPAWLSKALQMAAGGSDDDREFSDWIVEVFGLGSLDYTLSMTGVGRYAATMINDIRQGRRFNYPAPGPFRVLESLYSLAENRAKGDPVKLTQYLIEVSNAMPYTPVIPMHPVKSVGYVAHAVEEKIKPTGTVDFVRGAVTGRASTDSRR